MSHLSIHTDLDEYSLRFLQTGTCDIQHNTTDKCYRDTPPYDPFTDGCTNCNADSEYIREDTSQGFVICTHCGIALRTQILVSGTMNYTDDQGKLNDKTHYRSVGDPTNPFDDGALPKYPKGFKQEFIGKDGIKRLYDMSRLNVRYISHKQKDFWIVSEMLKHACVLLGNSGTLEKAKYIWSIIAKSDTVCRGANRRGLIGNCLMFASHHCKVCHTQDEVATALRINTTEITKGRKIFREIMLKEGREDIINIETQEKTMFHKLSSRIGVPKSHWSLVSKSEKMYDNYKHELSTLAPSSGIAGVLYYNIVKAGLKVTKGQIKDVCEVCTPTLNKALKIIEAVIKRDNKKST